MPPPFAGGLPNTLRLLLYRTISNRLFILGHVPITLPFEILPITIKFGCVPIPPPSIYIARSELITISE